MPLPRRILISRTDAIGDVVLTLPLATLLKQHLPGVHIGFLGRQYTEAVIECCSSVDEFVEMDSFLATDLYVLRRSWDTIIHVFPRKEIAQKAARAKIPQRIGTRSRIYHWATCNQLVGLKRKSSSLHEAQLNAVLLAPLGITGPFSTELLGRSFAMTNIGQLPFEIASLLQSGKRHIILHPKSAGSAREWGLAHFAELISMLPADKFEIFITGTSKDRLAMDELLKEVASKVIDLTGRLTLEELIVFINACDALVAASTGPLHVASAVGKLAIGLYPAIRPMHAGRWGPIGPNAVALSMPGDCNDCRRSPDACHCIAGISVVEVARHIFETLL